MTDYIGSTSGRHVICQQYVFFEQCDFKVLLMQTLRVSQQTDIYSVISAVYNINPQIYRSQSKTHLLIKFHVQIYVMMVCIINRHAHIRKVTQAHKSQVQNSSWACCKQRLTLIDCSHPNIFHLIKCRKSSEQFTGKHYCPYSYKCIIPYKV